VSSVLLDTHAWVWSFANDALLSSRARTAIREADTVYVSPISFFEIGQKVRTGRWPEMQGRVNELPAILKEQGGSIATLTPEICLDASTMDWKHRDPFDRLIVSTALALGVGLVSKDSAFEDRDDLTLVW
jgi:PIN domain nuclease of toxin-antitoxin system